MTVNPYACTVRRTSGIRPTDGGVDHVLAKLTGHFRDVRTHRVHDFTSADAFFVWLSELRDSVIIAPQRETYRTEDGSELLLWSVEIYDDYIE